LVFTESIVWSVTSLFLIVACKFIIVKINKLITVVSFLIIIDHVSEVFLLLISV